MLRRPLNARWIVLPLLLSAALIAPSIAADGPEKVNEIEGISEFRLDNGLRVLLFPDNSRPTVTVNLTIFVGSRHEGAGEGGMAHLLEHMVFKGTPLHKEIPKLLQDRGARFNGTTSADRTNYYETLPASADNLEFAIRMEADRMINSYIKGEDLASEMTVVRNEFERSENSNFRVLSQRMQAAAYEWHNYGKPTIGNHSDIERVPLPKLRDFYRKYYQPDNALLVVAGQFDPEQALTLIQKYFGAIEAPDRALERTYTEEPPQDGQRAVEVRRVGDVSLLGMAFHVPAGPHEDFPAVWALTNILGTEPSGRMYKALVETKMAANVYAMAYPHHDPSLLELYVEVRDADTLPAVRDTLSDVLQKIIDDGVTQEEVDRAIQQTLKQRELAEADTSQLAVSLSNWASQGDWRLYFLFRDRIEKVTPADVQRVAAQYLTPNNSTVGMFIPIEKPQRAEIPSTPDVQSLVDGYKGREMVAGGEEFDSSPQNIESRTERFTLPGGVKVVLLPKKTRGEAVVVELTLRYGNLDSLRGYDRAMTLLPTLMTQGTKQLSHQQIQDELDKNFATLAGYGSDGEATFGINTKRANLPAVMDLLRQVVREPTIPAEEFEVLRSQRLALYEEAQSDPQYQASIRLSQILSPYDKNDVRRIASIPERIEALKAMSVDDIRQLYRQIGGHAGEIAIVGDFDADAIKPMIESMFDGWDGATPYAPLEPQLFSKVVAVKEEILTPDKANATYNSGLHLAIGAENPDYAPMVIGNYLLGGGTLSSRLGNRVRQQEGLSYGVRSTFSADAVFPFAQLEIMAISNPQNTPRVVEVIAEELQLLLKDGITQDELDRAKQGYLQGQQVRRSDDDSLVSLLANTAYANRTMRFYADLESQIEALTTEQVDAALRKHVDLKRLVIVTAGDFEAAKAGAAP